MRKKVKIYLLILFIAWIMLGIFSRRDIIYLADNYRADGFDLWIAEKSNSSSIYEDLYKKYNQKYDLYGFEKHNLTNEYDNVFGIVLYHNNNFVEKFTTSVYWFNEQENAVMNELLINSKFNYIDAYKPPSEYQEPMLDGLLYVIPRWVDTLGLKQILFPFYTPIYIFCYYPQEGYMYISEDSEKISYDYSVGLHIFNIPKSFYKRK